MSESQSTNLEWRRTPATGILAANLPEDYRGTLYEDTRLEIHQVRGKYVAGFWQSGYGSRPVSPERRMHASEEGAKAEAAAFVDGTRNG